MKAFKIFLTISIINIILLSCGHIEDNTNNTIAEGFNIQELGLTLDLKFDKKFVDPNFPKYTPSFSQYHLDEEKSFITIDNLYEINGNITIISIEYSDSKIDMNFLPIMYLQGFYKSDISDNDNLIQLKKETYEMSKLNDYKVYEDNEVVVYNISSLLNILDFSSKIKILSKDSEIDYDYNWLKNMYNYFINQDKLKIYKQQNEIGSG